MKTDLLPEILDSLSLCSSPFNQLALSQIFTVFVKVKMHHREGDSIFHVWSALAQCGYHDLLWISYSVDASCDFISFFGPLVFLVVEVGLRA